MTRAKRRCGENPERYSEDCNFRYRKTTFRKNGTKKEHGCDVSHTVTSRETVTNLIPELLQKVDDGEIALSPVVELSYLSEKQQRILIDAMALNDCTPSHAQSIRLKNAAQQGRLFSDGIYTVLSEDYQVIPNMQEPIISEEEWLRVQELRQHRRRPTATGRTSLFSGLVYCYDCGAKLHFSAAKSITRNQEHFRCSNYKSGRGECTIHYIRDVVLERIVFEAICGLAEFVKCHETIFLYILAKKNNAMRQKEYRKLQQTVEQGNRRISEIDRLIEKVFEQNAMGLLSDERFAKMVRNYEKELTPTLVNSLIERIEVHNNDKSSGHCYVKVDIYFTAVGMIDIPTEQEILAMMEEIRNNPQEFRFVA